MLIVAALGVCIGAVLAAFGSLWVLGNRFARVEARVAVLETARKSMIKNVSREVVDVEIGKHLAAYHE
jgi:hypothetical protein